MDLTTAGVHVSSARCRQNATGALKCEISNGRPQTTVKLVKRTKTGRGSVTLTVTDKNEQLPSAAQVLSYDDS